MAVKNSLLNMILCLFGITAVCALLLGVVYVVTAEPIAKAEDAKNTEAISQVCPSFDSLKVTEKDGKPLYYTASLVTGEIVGYVVYASSVGFGGPINLMVGFRPDGSIYNTVVLSHSETPGLGAKCTEETFASQFRDFNPAEKVLKVKEKGGAGGDVDAITASTITSRAYCAALQNAVDFFNGTIMAAEKSDMVTPRTPADTEAVTAGIENNNMEGTQNE